ncbi:hypothetical protein HK405_010627, partial [Cladochytrium tenue]
PGALWFDKAEKPLPMTSTATTAAEAASGPRRLTPRLVVRVGAAFDHCDLIVPVNDDFHPVVVDGPHFCGRVVVRVRDYNGVDDSTPNAAVGPDDDSGATAAAAGPTAPRMSRSESLHHHPASVSDLPLGLSDLRLTDTDPSSEPDIDPTAAAAAAAASSSSAGTSRRASLLRQRAASVMPSSSAAAAAALGTSAAAASATAPPRALRNSEYFTHSPERKRLFSIQIQGRFKTPDLSMDDIVYGTFFERPVVQPPLVWIPMRLATLIDPSLFHDFGAQRPCAYSPAIGTFNIVDVRRAPPTTSAADAKPAAAVGDPAAAASAFLGPWEWGGGAELVESHAFAISPPSASESASAAARRASPVVAREHGRRAVWQPVWPGRGRRWSRCWGY